jgi:hypothetical protein
LAIANIAPPPSTPATSPVSSTFSTFLEQQRDWNPVYFVLPEDRPIPATVGILPPTPEERELPPYRPTTDFWGPDVNPRDIQTFRSNPHDFIHNTRGTQHLISESRFLPLIHRNPQIGFIDNFPTHSTRANILGSPDDFLKSYLNDRVAHEAQITFAHRSIYYFDKQYQWFLEEKQKEEHKIKDAEEYLQEITCVYASEIYQVHKVRLSWIDFNLAHIREILGALREVLSCQDAAEKLYARGDITDSNGNPNARGIVEHVADTHSSFLYSRFFLPFPYAI